MVEVTSQPVSDKVLKGTQTSWACLEGFPLHSRPAFALLAALPVFQPRAKKFPCLGQDAGWGYLQGLYTGIGGPARNLSSRGVNVDATGTFPCVPR